MFEQHTSALSRPRHALDVPAFAVWALAATGSATLALAHALDRAFARRSAAPVRDGQRPRARVGPSGQVHAKHFVPDSWRIR